MVPDPVGLLDCVEDRVDLPYMKAWVECTNSLGQNVATSRDIINYRCKSVWEGKGIIPEVYYIKDCVIEKMGLPGPNVSAIILGAYNECERSSPMGCPQQGTKNVQAFQNRIPQQQPAFVQQAHLQPVQQFRPPSSRQYFTIYPSAPLPMPQMISQQNFYQQAQKPSLPQPVDGTQGNRIVQQQIHVPPASPQPIPHHQQTGAYKGPYQYEFSSSHPMSIKQ